MRFDDFLTNIEVDKNDAELCALALAWLKQRVLEKVDDSDILNCRRAIISETPDNVKLSKLEAFIEHVSETQKRPLFTGTAEQIDEDANFVASQLNITVNELYNETDLFVSAYINDNHFKLKEED